MSPRRAAFRDSRRPRPRLVAALILLAVSGALLASGCAALRRAAVYPSARVEGLGIQELDATAMTVRIDLAVTNPYGVALPVTGLEIGLSSDSTQFFSGSAAVEDPIPPSGTRTVAVPVRVPWLQVIQALGAIRPGNELDLRADLGLTLRTPVAGDVRLPLTYSRRVTVPEVR
ncbi:MAG: LEA type 2 family protein [Candidatus Eisenbacteria bacterium]